MTGSITTGTQSLPEATANTLDEQEAVFQDGGLHPEGGLQGNGGPLPDGGLQGNGGLHGEGGLQGNGGLHGNGRLHSNGGLRDGGIPQTKKRYSNLYENLDKEKIAFVNAVRAAKGKAPLQMKGVFAIKEVEGHTSDYSTRSVMGDET